MSSFSVSDSGFLLTCHSGDGSRMWGPVPHLGDLDCMPCFQLCPGYCRCLGRWKCSLVCCHSTLQIRINRCTGIVGQLVTLPLRVAVSHTLCCLSLSYSASCRSAWKTADHGPNLWIPATVGETQMEFMAPGLSLAQPWMSGGVNL